MHSEHSKHVISENYLESKEDEGVPLHPLLLELVESRLNLYTEHYIIKSANTINGISRFTVKFLLNSVKCVGT